MNIQKICAEISNSVMTELFSVNFFSVYITFVHNSHIKAIFQFKIGSTCKFQIALMQYFFLHNVQMNIIITTLVYPKTSME